MIRFQQEPNGDKQLPWSVIIGDDGSVVHGRPDAKYLSGFGPVGVQDITLFWKDALADPAKVVGLVPVFIDHGAKMFGVDLKVTSCEVYEADENVVAKLVEREQQMREIAIRLDL